MFEVVECSWVELVAATEVARDVDDIIAAHDNYLRKIKSGTLCQKDVLFDCILELQQLMISLWKDIDGELELLADVEKVKKLNNYSSRIQVIAKKFQMNRQIKYEK